MDPIILHANTYRFAPDQVIESGPVASRMQLWCLEGRGRLWVEGEEEPLLPGVVLLLPWGFRIRYRSDRRRPWRLAGIHLVPRAADLDPMPFGQVPHAGEALAGLADGDDPIFHGRHRRDWDPGGAWSRLSDYIVLLHQRGLPVVAEQRRLAQQLVVEWRRGLAADPHAEPPGLAAIRSFVQAHPDTALGLDQLAAIAGCAPATLSRRVRAAHGCSPTRWVQALRVEHAKHLLEDRDLAVADIAARLGFCDPFYFSRIFKHHTGLAPRHWRERRRLL